MSTNVTSGPKQQSGTISGRKLVIMLFAFGALATATLWGYWQLHMMPFMPLQAALVEAFGKDCAPRVEGGQRKMHKQTTRMLRVVMRVPFDPEIDDSETQARIVKYLTQVRDIAENHVDITEYDTLELHLFQENQEQALKQFTVRKNLKSWQDVNEDGTVPVAD
jgi:hypothetical protein